MDKLQREKLDSMLSSLYKITNKPLMFFDIETSGLDMVKDEIIQLYTCVYDEMGFRDYEQKFSIDGEIAPEAFEKHGLSKEYLSQFPKFSELAKDIYKTYFKKEYVICGFNSLKFDIPFTIEKFLECKIMDAVSISTNKAIDVYKLYTELYPNTLSAIYQRFTDEVLENSHSADFDIYATVTILDKLLEKNPDIELFSKGNFLDAGRFFEVVDKKIIYAVGKHKGQSVLDMDFKESSGYLRWIANNNTISKHTKMFANKLLEKMENMPI